MAGQSELMETLELEPAGEGRFVGHNLVSTPGSVVFGGQLLAQTVVAAAAADPSKEVKSVHTVFARGGALDQDLQIEVEPLHLGRALGSVTVTIRQGERLCTRSLVLLSAAEPDLIRHQPHMPDVGGPGDATPVGGEPGFWEIRVVGGVDIADPASVGPAPAATCQGCAALAPMTARPGARPPRHSPASGSPACRPVRAGTSGCRFPA